MTMMKHSSAKAAVNFSTTGSFSHIFTSFPLLGFIVACVLIPLNDLCQFLLSFFYIQDLRWLNWSGFPTFHEGCKYGMEMPQMSRPSGTFTSNKTQILKSNPVDEQTSPLLQFGFIFSTKKVVCFELIYFCPTPPPTKCFHVLFPRNSFNLYPHIFNIIILNTLT